MNDAAKREAWLDVLRAAAILSVVTYHMVQMAPARLSVGQIASYGRYGVDLFFVLSGFLIGRLLWKELGIYGNVEIGRFWLRRALRTMPPYFVALGVSWTAVAYDRGEKFDWGYLLFLQNYYERMPFFLVSWSLCIEEHFYAVVPLGVVCIVGRYGLNAISWTFAVSLSVSPVIRIVEYRGDSSSFGYLSTATHLNMDGLLVGFLASLLVSRNPRLPELAASRVGIGVIVLLGTVAVAIQCSENDVLIYAAYPTIQALTFGFILMAGVGHGVSLQGGMGGLVRTVAICSYSAYLVHPIAIHVALATAGRFGEAKSILYWPVVAACILAATALFYVTVERSSIALRDWLVPRRSEGGERAKRYDLSCGRRSV